MGHGRSEPAVQLDLQPAVQLELQPIVAGQPQHRAQQRSAARPAAPSLCCPCGAHPGCACSSTLRGWACACWAAAPAWTRRRPGRSQTPGAIGMGCVHACVSMVRGGARQGAAWSAERVVRRRRLCRPATGAAPRPDPPSAPPPCPGTCCRKRWSCGWELGSRVTSNRGAKMLASSCGQKGGGTRDTGGCGMGGGMPTRCHEHAVAGAGAGVWEGSALPAPAPASRTPAQPLKHPSRRTTAPQQAEHASNCAQTPTHTPTCSKFSMMPCSLYTLYRRGTCTSAWGVRTGAWVCGWVGVQAPAAASPEPRTRTPTLPLPPAPDPSTAARPLYHHRHTHTHRHAGRHTPHTWIIHTLLSEKSRFCTTHAASVSHSTGLRPYTLMRYSAGRQVHVWCVRVRVCACVCVWIAADEWCLRRARRRDRRASQPPSGSCRLPAGPRPVPRAAAARTRVLVLGCLQVVQHLARQLCQEAAVNQVVLYMDGWMEWVERVGGWVGGG